MSDLSLISSDELWEEICRRNTVVVMATLKEYDDKREAVQVSFSGGKFSGIGLATHLLDVIKEEALHPDSEAEGE